MSREYHSSADLREFKNVQKLAYEAVEFVRNGLTLGTTEKEAADRIDAYVREKGGKNFFHYGFAWFGDRTCFRGFRRPLTWRRIGGDGILPHFGTAFQPSNRKLERGMAVILDVAPNVKGVTADVGYSFSFGENPEVERGREDLKEFRTLILDSVLAERSMAAIYKSCDRLIADLGYSNCHTIYPNGVLGHKVGRVPGWNFPGGRVLGFPPQTFFYLLPQMFKGAFSSSSPLWGEFTKSRVDAGLWAVEPHIGKLYSGSKAEESFGVKWEEILVVGDNGAYWLDDDLPHVRFWKEKEIGRNRAKRKGSGSNARTSSKRKFPVSA
ncbi:M24 family metallopeptidase [Leptospira ellisii]|uniref:Metallopeptidase n=1 Tax=Leptospira ellisii TaxID=2023197 RepID=A0A2N0BLH7_9LEPT|nr:M24 family metallopeptidase [Leptospira ellisii]MDV6236657.1 M24 family metallopeptidase [Leptospira ellisii]PJZ91611.1 metallopeptidase [Leptospira ellisii]PKA04847.1 metallopeptidase [Leptospira ellisii]